MDYFHPIPLLRVVLLVVLLAPLGAAVVCGLAGYAGRNPRRFAMWFATLHLGLTVILVGFAAVQLTHRGDPIGSGWSPFRPDAGFMPIAVPGDPGIAGDRDSQTHETTWGLLPLGTRPDSYVPPPEVQFFVGLDGLNIWLVGLTSLMVIVSLLVSWDSVTDRAGAFYAWLFVLQTGVLGAFVAFDVILFYVFFELTLVPTFFLIGYWGVGGGRRDAARKFFLYTLFGSLLTLTGLVGIVLTNPTPIHPQSGRPIMTTGPVLEDGTLSEAKEGPITFSIPRLMQNVTIWSYYRDGRAILAGRAEAASRNQTARDKATAERTAAEAERDRAGRVQTWLFVLLVAGFMVKVPVVPFHTWLPPAYAEAPTGVVVLLSALLAKLGTFGILRLVLPLAPDAALEYGLPVVGALGAVGIVYGAFCAFAQRDMKLLVAYSSVSHLGFVVIALFTFNEEGITGATLHMINHGLATGALFALLGFLSERYRTLDMNQYGGLWAKFPAYTFLAFVIGLAGIGLPGLNNFVSEMLMLAGLFDPSVTRSLGYALAVAAAFGILLSAWYILTMFRRVFFGPLHEPPTAAGPVRHITGREAFAFGVPAALCVLLGLFPQPVIGTIRADAKIVTEFGNHSRERVGSLVERPLQLPAGALLGGPGIDMRMPGMPGAQPPRLPGGRPPGAPADPPKDR
jgi:NADH-quinone oxidoreductase subunit M